MRLYGLRLQDSGAGCESFLIMRGTVQHLTAPGPHVRRCPPSAAILLGREADPLPEPHRIAADPIQQAEPVDRHRQARVSDP
jgi:hypothetical protein